MSRERVKRQKPNGWHSSVTHEEFVKVWQASASGAEVADKLDLTKQAVHQRAAMLRARGVKLKPMRGYQRINVEALNALCQ